MPSESEIENMYLPFQYFLLHCLHNPTAFVYELKSSGKKMEHSAFLFEVKDFPNTLWKEQYR